MTKKKIFFGAAAMVLAIAAVVATKANPPLPDYYFNDDEECVEAPVTNCVTGGNTCDRAITGQTGLKQIYDQRTASGTCIVELKNP